MYSQKEIYFTWEHYEKSKDFIKKFADLRYLSDISLLQRWVYSRDKSAISKQRAAWFRVIDCTYSDKKAFQFTHKRVFYYNTAINKMKKIIEKMVRKK